MYIKILLRTTNYKQAILSILGFIALNMLCIYFLDLDVYLELYLIQKKYIIFIINIFFIQHILKIVIFKLKKIKKLKKIIKDFGSSFKTEYDKNKQIKEIIFLNNNVILLEENNAVLVSYEDIKLIFIQSTLTKNQQVKNNLVVIDKDKNYYYVKINKEDEDKTLKTFKDYCPNIFIGYNKDLEESILKDENISEFEKEHKDKKFEIDISNDSMYYETIPIYSVYKKIIGRKLYYNLYNFVFIFVIIAITIDALIFKNTSSLTIFSIILAFIIEFVLFILILSPFIGIYYLLHFLFFKNSKSKDEKYTHLKRLKNRKFFEEREYKDFYNIFISDTTIIFFTKDLKEYLLLDKEIIWVYMTTISRRLCRFIKKSERNYNGLVIVDRDNNQYEIIIEKEDYYTNNILKEIEKNLKMYT